MNKEDNFKEKFKRALISTAKVISDDYRPNINKKNSSSNNFDFLELDNLNNRHDFIRLRAETDSEALKKKFSDKKIYQIRLVIRKLKSLRRSPSKKNQNVNLLIILLIDRYITYLKRYDMNFLAQKC